MADPGYKSWVGRHSGVQNSSKGEVAQVTLEAKADAVDEVAFDTRDLKIQGVSLEGSTLKHRLEDAHKVPPNAHL